MAYEANKHECLLRRRIEAGEILRGLSRGIEQNKPALEGIERGFVIGSDREELLLAAAVHSSLKGGARNELRDLGSRDGDGVARSGVATGAFRTILKLERAEANERKGLAALNSSHNFFDYRTENAVGFCLGNGILFGNLFDKIHAIHRLSPYVFVQCAASPKKKASSGNKIDSPICRILEVVPSSAVFKAQPKRNTVKQRPNDSPDSQGMQ